MILVVSFLQVGNQVASMERLSQERFLAFSSSLLSHLFSAFSRMQLRIEIFIYLKPPFQCVGCS